MFRFAILACTALVMCVAALAGDIPKLIDRADRAIQQPLWVSVDLAFGTAGDLRPSLFSNAAEPMAAPSIPGAAPTSGGDASFRFLKNEDRTNVWGGSIGGTKPDQNISDLLENAVAIYHGRVTQIEYGFYDGRPGALLKANVLEAPRRGTAKADDGLLLFYNYARFQSGGTRFCAGFREPHVGDEFIVFAYYPPADESHAIVDAANRIFFRSPEGRVEAIPGWATRLRLRGQSSATVLSFKSLQETIRRFMPGQVQQ